MKIIFSPSKEMREKNILSINLKYKNIKFQNKTQKIMKSLQKLPKEEIENLMKVKNNLLVKTMDNIINYDRLEKIPAVCMYNGVAFKKIDLLSYNIEDFEFMENNFFILSALYGATTPLTLIKRYRLDMTIKLPEINLYEFWKKDVSRFLLEHLEENEILLNLASEEFSKMLDKKLINNIVNIDFKNFKNGKYKSISSYVKQARGYFFNEIVKNKIVTTEELKKVYFKNYILNEDLSTKNNFVFTN